MRYRLQLNREWSEIQKSGDNMNWKAFEKALLHALVGGAAAGAAAASAGGGSLKSIALGALGSAVSSVFSLFRSKPAVGGQ